MQSRASPLCYPAITVASGRDVKDDGDIGPGRETVKLGSLDPTVAALQERIFRLLGMSDGEMERKFGHLLSTLRSGAPPHGGIALGMDRLVKMFTDAPSLREVVAFPKTTAARALFEGAPSPVESEELAALGLKLAD